MNLTRRQFIQSCSIFSATAVVPGAAFSSPSPKLKAGVAKIKITPPLSIPYLTSSGNGTSAPFQGAHCDLFAKALVLDDGKNSIALLAVDSIGYDNMILGCGRNFTRELRQKIAAKTKLLPESIMLSATHAHSTPETIGLTFFRETAGASEWLENHLNELADVAIAAWKNREPVRAFFGVRKVEGIARHRRIVLKNGKLSRYGPLPAENEIAVPWKLDEDLSLLFLQKPDGSPHSVLMNYTAHPVVSMLLPNVCADYPGAATALVEQKMKGAVCLFTNGAAGNVNSVKVSTNYDDVEALGKLLGEAALAEVEKIKGTSPLQKINLRSSSTEVQLQPRSCPKLAEAEQTMWLKPSSENKRLFRLAKKLSEDSLRAEIQTMSLGPLKWISLPGEPFVETGFALKRAGANFVVGYANGWHGYFPLRRAYDEGGYEAEVGAWSRVAPGSAEQLEVAGIRLLQKI